MPDAVSTIIFHPISCPANPLAPMACHGLSITLRLPAFKIFALWREFYDSVLLSRFRKTLGSSHIESNFPVPVANFCVQRFQDHHRRVLNSLKRGWRIADGNKEWEPAGKRGSGLIRQQWACSGAGRGGRDSRTRTNICAVKGF
jgi:hypothetical protein